MAQLPPTVPYHALPDTGEQAYYPPPVPGQPVQLVARRAAPWYKHWVCWFGDCDEIGWGSCALASFLPCVAFGLNVKNALSQSALLWAFVFFLLGMLPTTICYNIQWVKGSVHEVEHACFFSLTPIFGISGAAWLGLVGLIGRIALGTWNRYRLQKEFGLEGNCFTGCLLWTFCVPCVLAQETRTLWYNNVANGLWQGPSQVYQPPAEHVAPRHYSPYPNWQQAQHDPAVPATVPAAPSVPPAQMTPAEYPGRSDAEESKLGDSRLPTLV